MARCSRTYSAPHAVASGVAYSHQMRSAGQLQAFISALVYALR